MSSVIIVSLSDSRPERAKLRQRCFADMKALGFPVFMYLDRPTPELEAQVAGHNFSVNRYEQGATKEDVLRHVLLNTGSDFILWLDDDFGFVNTQRARNSILEAAETTGSYFGLRMECGYQGIHGFREWARQFPWHQGKSHRLNSGQEGILYSTGCFWMARTSVLRQLNWPPPGIKWFDDLLLGEAMRQLDIDLTHLKAGYVQHSPTTNWREVLGGKYPWETEMPYERLEREMQDPKELRRQVARLLIQFGLER